MKALCQIVRDGHSERTLPSTLALRLLEAGVLCVLLVWCPRIVRMNLWLAASLSACMLYAAEVVVGRLCRQENSPRSEAKRNSHKLPG